MICQENNLSVSPLRVEPAFQGSADPVSLKTAHCAVFRALESLKGEPRLPRTNFDNCYNGPSQATHEHTLGREKHR